MATTGELRAIIRELELIHIGDAASYLGEETTVDGELQDREQEVSTLSYDVGDLATC